jgi:hypothetical protein
MSDHDYEILYNDTLWPNILSLGADLPETDFNDDGLHRAIRGYML